MQETVIQEYEICPYTMAVLPEETDKGLYSKVLEVEGTYIVSMKPIDIMERSCRYFGSSLQGRKDGTSEIMGITHKAPIAIDPVNFIYFFPTSSPTRQHCAWISHTFVQKFVATPNNLTTLIFTNKQTITLPVSKGSLENQLFRTAQLRSILSRRISFENTKIPSFPTFQHPLRNPMP